MLIQTLVNGISLGSAYALTALGFAIIYRTLGIFHFAHGSVYAFSAHVAYSLITLVKMPLIPSVLLTMLAGGILGMIINFLIYEPLKRHASSGQVYMIASMGASIVLQNLIATAWGAITKVLVLPNLETSLYNIHHIGSAVITMAQLLVVIVTVVALATIALFSKSMIGLSIIALGNDSEVAENLGMKVKAIRYITLAVGSALAALSAVLVSIDLRAVDSAMGVPIMLMTIIAVIVGGTANFGAAIAGGYLIGLIKNFGIWAISAEWDNTLLFIMLVLVIMFKPAGLFGRKISKLGR
ncbi:MAG: branched-chain amino acid ABC transporter permease [Clostridiales bacterium]|jgi:branched-chain amino acid transport system permease protein|nr:branched-chain amino acid ABC transporter permease [Clostridiales bacterium]